MTGQINTTLEAVMPIVLRNSAGVTVTMEAIVDTGFTHFIAIPPAVVAQLGLQWYDEIDVILANGSQITVDRYMVTVMWDGLPFMVTAEETGHKPLIGMALLHGFRVDLPVRVGKTITITALPARTVP